MQDSPLAILQAANLYLFTVHNPVMFVDPSGEFAITATIVAAVLVSLVLVAALATDYLMHGDNSAVGRAASAVVDIGTGITSSRPGIAVPFVPDAVRPPADYVVAEEWISTLDPNTRHHYFPAMLYGGAIWVAPTGISRSAALNIVGKNDRNRGVMALTSSQARSLATSAGGGGGGGGVRGPENHGAGSGFWPHFHAGNFPHAHIWFIS